MMVGDDDDDDKKKNNNTMETMKMNLNSTRYYSKKLMSLSYQ